MKKSEALHISKLMEATASYYANEWPFGDTTDVELNAVISAICSPTQKINHWFDLGSGPIGPLWIPFIRPKHVTLTDLNGEHLLYAQERIKEIKAERLLPVEQHAIEQASSIYKDTPSIKSYLDCKIKTASLNLEKLQFAPESLAEADLVTAIGSLGCLPDEETLETAFFWLGQHIMKGRLVVAVWLGTKSQETEKYDSWQHLYYNKCVSRNMTPESLATLARKHFSYVKTETIELGEGRQLCIAEMRNNNIG